MLPYFSTVGWNAALQSIWKPWLIKKLKKYLFGWPSRNI